jgi:hypothetical protein
MAFAIEEPFAIEKPVTNVAEPRSWAAAPRALSNTKARNMVVVIFIILKSPYATRLANQCNAQNLPTLSQGLFVDFQPNVLSEGHLLSRQVPHHLRAVEWHPTSASGAAMGARLCLPNPLSR